MIAIWQAQASSTVIHLSRERFKEKNEPMMQGTEMEKFQRVRGWSCLLNHGQQG